jgi:hypothetical protein
MPNNERLQGGYPKGPGLKATTVVSAQVFHAKGFSLGKLVSYESKNTH